jgi:hypothetical protein
VTWQNTSTNDASPPSETQNEKTPAGHSGPRRPVSAKAGFQRTHAIKPSPTTGRTIAPDPTQPLGRAAPLQSPVVASERALTDPVPRAFSLLQTAAQSVNLERYEEVPLASGLWRGFAPPSLSVLGLCLLNEVFGELAMLSERRHAMLQESSDRRALRRFDVRLPAAVRLAGGAVGEFITETQNVSARGVFFYLDRAVTEGALLEVTMTFPSHITLTDPLRVRFLARVVRVEGPSPSLRIGVAAVIEEYEFLRSDGSPNLISGFEGQSNADSWTGG